MHMFTYTHTHIHTASDNPPSTGGSGSSSSLGLTVGITVPILVIIIALILIVAIVIVIMKYGSSHRRGKESITASVDMDGHSSFETPDLPDSDTPDLAKRQSAIEMKAMEDRKPHKLIPSPPTLVDQFSAHVEEFDAKRQLLFQQEFDVSSPGLLDRAEMMFPPLPSSGSRPSPRGTHQRLVMTHGMTRRTDTATSLHVSWRVSGS